MQPATSVWPRAREEQLTFIETILHDDRDSSYIVAWTDSGKWRQRPFRARSICLDDIPSGESVYMTRNGFVGGKREAELCRQVNAMMFDLDCHTASFRDDVPKVISAIDEAVANGVLPQPNLMVDTGRGVQVYFVLATSISFRVSNGNLNDMGLAYYKDVEEALASTVRGVVEPLEGVQFDASVLDYSRVGRIPGTFNPKAKRWCTLVSADSSFYTLKELKKFGTKSPYSHVKRAQKVRTRRKKGLLESRLSGVERLQKHRKYDCQGSRENMCFVYYNTATQIYGPDKALEITHELNGKFTTPLPPADIEQIARTVDKTTVLYGEHQGEQGFYPLRAATVIEKLFMTNEEMEAIRFFGTKRQRDRAAQRARNQAAKQDRDARIVRKFRMGSTQQEIADEIGCSKRTVANVLNKNGIRRGDRFSTKDKFDQVIVQKRESAISRHTSWLCAPLGGGFPQCALTTGALTGKKTFEDTVNGFLGGFSPPLLT